MRAKILVPLFLAACGSAQTPTYETPAAAKSGKTLVSVKAADVTGAGVTVSAQPAGITQALTQDTSGNFSGALVLPSGSETLTAVVTDANGNTIGTGSTSVVVVEGVSSAVALTIAGTPQGQSSIAPILTAVTVSNLTATAGEAVTVSASATDLQGNAVTYQWTSTCADGAFADATAATTTWSKASEGACTLTVTATSSAGAASQSLNVAVLSGPGDGAVTITGTFVQAWIQEIFVSSPAGNAAWIFPSSSADSSMTSAMTAGVGTSVYLYVSSNGTGETATLTDSCGGVIANSQAGSYEYVFTWTPASVTTPTACELTTSVLLGSAVLSTYSVGVLVNPASN